jgi:hypothetical protein
MMGNQRRATRDAVEGSGTVGNAVEYQPATPEDQRWFEEYVKRQPTGRVLVRLDDEQDVSGHMAFEDPTLIQLVVQDDEPDTEGHAISIRLPTVEEADAFRRRLLLTGVLVGAVVLGGAGAALAVSQTSDGPPASAATQTTDDVSYEDATPYSGTV